MIMESREVTKSNVISSLIWKFLERGGTQGVQFIVSIILARLLAPADFGVIALVLVFLNIADVFVQSGFNTALVQKKDADNLDFSSVFYVSIGVSVLLYVAIFFSAPFVANFYNRPELVSIVRVLSFTLIIGAVNSIQEAYITRNLLFKKLFYRSISVAIPAGAIGIFFAYRGMGVWALVIQRLATAFLLCLFMWFSVKWRPQLIFSISRVKKLFSFGWKLLASALLNTGYNELHSFVIGKMFAPAALGFYSRGHQFPSIIVSNVNTSIQSVLLPTMSSYQDDRVRLKQMTRRAIVTSSYVIVPLMACLAALAKPLVLVLLGEKWLPCVPFIQICCITYSFWPIHTSNLSAINAVGRSDVFLKLELIKKSVGISVLCLFIYLFRTPIGIATTGAATALIGAFINAHPNKRLLNYGYFEQMRDVVPSYILSITIGGIIYYLTNLSLNPWLQLILYPLIGVGLYFSVSKILHLECFEYLISLIKEFKDGHRNKQVNEGT